ncbi:DapH/DapD/GlmU-related protein [Eubacterium sp. AB3007]|uniref:acyltransferase n=1 Tax=Eubacterium sp. AB3007 TaxID=1392487 RepID=UPI00068B7FEE|nr:acyltransferase [Eubacterium sp. AB3007]
MDLGYQIAKLKAKMIGRKGYAYGEIVNRYFRKKGVEIGERCLIYSNIITNEPYLITIKNDVVVSTDVCFVTHDYSIHSVCPTIGNLFGNITIGNNCFIGERAILMYGVELADNIIVAAGSVVANSFSESNIIIGGNPAKKIGTWDKFRITGQKYGYGYPITREYADNHPENMVHRKVR